MYLHFSCAEGHTGASDSEDGLAEDVQWGEGIGAVGHPASRKATGQSCAPHPRCPCAGQSLRLQARWAPANDHLLLQLALHPTPHLV